MQAELGDQDPVCDSIFSLHIRNKGMLLTKRITRAELGDQYAICDSIFCLTISCNPVTGV